MDVGLAVGLAMMVELRPVAGLHPVMKPLVAALKSTSAPEQAVVSALATKVLQSLMLTETLAYFVIPASAITTLSRAMVLNT